YRSTVAATPSTVILALPSCGPLAMTTVTAVPSKASVALAAVGAATRAEPPLNWVAVLVVQVPAYATRGSASSMRVAPPARGVALGGRGRRGRGRHGLGAEGRAAARVEGQHLVAVAGARGQAAVRVGVHVGRDGGHQRVAARTGPPPELEAGLVGGQVAPGDA